MKKILIAASVAVAMTSGNVFAEAAKLSSDDDKLSYSLGMLIGDRILSQYPEKIDYFILLEAMRAQHKGEETVITMDEAHTVMQASEEKAAAIAAEKAKSEAATAIALGQAFMLTNKSVEGVMVTESGIQYQVLTAAEGAKPKATDKVKVHYKGTTIDGTTFDSSYDRGEPAEFGLNQVIPGWTEGVQLMSVGSKYKFVIPSNLAYGDQGAGSSIGPGETLIFEVELLEILSAEQ